MPSALTSASYPPLKSKHVAPGPTAYELQMTRRRERNEKSRLRMAVMREERKRAPLEEQEALAARSRSYQATYREKNRRDLKIWEMQRRDRYYIARYGPVAYNAYADARIARRRAARRKRLAKEAYHPGDAPNKKA